MLIFVGINRLRPEIMRLEQRTHAALTNAGSGPAHQRYGTAVAKVVNNHQVLGAHHLHAPQKVRELR